jgi:transketolase
MRDIFIKTLEKKVKKNDNTILITADLGFGVLDNFKKKFPKKFINVGICEQNMIGLATGLSNKGFNVFCYSLGNFPSMRCLEQIRNDAAYHNANIKIVNVGGGYSYGPLGFSHHATEDLSFMRCIPNVKIIAPCCSEDTEALTHYIFRAKGLFYLRLDKQRNQEFKIQKRQIKFGKICNIKKGNGLAIFSIGGITNEVYKVSEVLKKRKINCSIYNCHTLKPFDTKINILLKKYKKIVVVEENSVLGGLNGEISEHIAKLNLPDIQYLNFGIKDKFQKVVGDRSYLLKKNNLDYLQISNKILKSFNV